MARSLRLRPTGLVAVALSGALLAGCSAAAAQVVPEPGAPARLAVVRAAQSTPAASPTHQADRARSIYAGRIHAYGDSVMLGASWALRKRLHARVDAQVSRQCGSVVALVRKDFRRGAIRGPVVIHTGTNGVVAGCPVGKVVRKVQRRHAVVLVNVHLPARYTWTSSNNRALAKLARRWRNVVLFDWHRIASRHPGWLAGDGTHLTSSGASGYERQVARLLHR